MQPGCQLQGQCSPADRIHAMRDTDIQVRVLSRNTNGELKTSLNLLGTGTSDYTSLTPYHTTSRTQYLAGSRSNIQWTGQLMLISTFHWQGSLMLNSTLVQGYLDVTNFVSKAVRFTLISANISHVTCKQSNKSVNISWFDIHTNIIWPTAVRNRLHPYLG